MQRLVEQLLLLTRADEGAVLRTPRDVDLDDLALDRGESGTPKRAGRRHAPAVQPAGSGATRSRSRQVVRNLVDNAARHADVIHRARCPGGRRRSVELSVEDDGPGIPEDQRERVFERFVRLDEARAREPAGAVSGSPSSQEIVQRPRRDGHRLVRPGTGRRPVRRTASGGGGPDVLTT